MKRSSFLHHIESAFKTNPVVTLLGPRQCGKTTLAKDFAKGEKTVYFDLENPRDLAQFQNPLLTLESQKGIVIIDEIQRRPELFPVLRSLVDQSKRKKKFLILGSASRDLIKQSSESLAGRISHIQLTPFNASEVGPQNLEKLWYRGGFPLSLLANSNATSLEWRRNYISTYLERDIPNLGFQVPAPTLRRFWMMLTHVHGQIFNASELGRSMGAAHTTIRNYLDILSGTFMVRQLSPWHENLGKRQVKSPKIYFRDSGIFHALLGLDKDQQIQSNPKLGASWEGFAMEEVIRRYQLRDEDVYFWGTHNKAELDLFFIKKGKRIGFEFKFTDAPKLTPSMMIAKKDLKLNHLFVVFPGKGSFPLEKNIQALGFEKLTISKDIF